MIKFNPIKYLILFIITGVLAACSEIDPISGEQNVITHSIYATLDNPATRAGGSNWNDEWTMSGFTAGDKAGLFSTRGNNLENTGAGGFYNEEMTYDKGSQGTSVNQFVNDNLQINTYQLNQGSILMYVPYCETIADPGLELRTKVDDIYRCKDVLSAYIKRYDRGVLNVTFDHQFCVVIIVRGKDFDKPQRPQDTDPGDADEITFVLDKGYSHMKIASTPNSWQPYPQLVYQPNYIPTGSDKEMTEDQCRRWNAWKGGDYNGQDAWYILLPTNLNLPGSYPVTNIDYIELWDNYGNLQKISSFRLGDATDRKVYSSNVCPLRVQMDELGPTVFPYPIEKWNEDEDISIRRSKGINDVVQYNQWVEYYNNYTKMEPESEGFADAEKNLSSFGDKIDGIWHFNLLTSLNGETLNKITVLKDILDGQSNVLEDGFYKNNSISNMNINQPLIDKIEGGQIINLDFENIDLQSTSSNNPLGVIAGEISEASFRNCNIRASIMSNGPVGLISGNVVNCNIEKCVFSGFLIGNSSYSGSNCKYLFGNSPTGNIKITGSDIGSIIFSNIKI